MQLVPAASVFVQSLRLAAFVSNADASHGGFAACWSRGARAHECPGRVGRRDNTEHACCIKHRNRFAGRRCIFTCGDVSHRATHNRPVHVPGVSVFPASAHVEAVQVKPPFGVCVQLVPAASVFVQSPALAAFASTADASHGGLAACSSRVGEWAKERCTVV